MYASSKTTSTGSARMARTSSSLNTEPSGLLGDVRNTALGLCSATARLMPSMSILKPSNLGTVMVRALFTSASKVYMVKVGGQSTMASPGSSTQRMRRSISSSAPQPTRRCSTGMSFMAARAPLKRRVSGSGYTWGKGISAKALLTSSGGPYGFSLASSLMMSSGLRPKRWERTSKGSMGVYGASFSKCGRRKLVEGAPCWFRLLEVSGSLAVAARSLVVVQDAILL
mmetsp:Transcript_5450/g.14728  ORF Transcript_5450/g.14728 Transcript_5450/m.14728 type:complete len:227 (-) Transcript_5450:159-839(-)